MNELITPEEARTVILQKVAEIRGESVVDWSQMPAIFSSHKGQEEAWFAKEAIIAVFAGWQSGKSVAGPPWLMREIQDRGPGDYAVLAPTYPLLRKKALPELLRYMRTKLVEGEDFVFKAGDMEVHITEAGGRKFWPTGGTVCIYLVNANNPQAVEAFTAKSIWIDEPGQIPDETWESVQARVAVEEGRIFLTSRPYDHNWYVREIWNKRDDPRIKVVNFSSKDNPAFPDEEYYRQKKLLPWWKFRMKYDGIPTKPAGAIYDCFEETFTDPEGNELPPKQVQTKVGSQDLEITMTGANVCLPFDIPNTWPRLSGHDFGPVNTAGVFAAKDPVTCKVYIYRSYHSGKKTTPEHVTEFRNRCGFKPQGSWGGAPSEEKTRNDFTRAGWQIQIPPIADVIEGITRVYALIKSGILVVFSDLETLIQDFLTYSWKLDEYGEPLSDEAKNIDAKSSFHRLDAVRYLAVAIYEGCAHLLEVADRFAPMDETYEYPDERAEEGPFAHLGWN